MAYTIEQFLADLAPRAGWDDATFDSLKEAVSKGELSDEHAKILQEAAHNMGTVDFFRNDRSTGSIVSHARAEVWDGVTNDTMNSLLELYGDILDPSEIKLAFSNPKERFGSKRDSILKAIREKFEAKMKGLVNSDSVNRLIEEKDSALQELREKLSLAKAETENEIKRLRRSYEEDLIRRDVYEMVASMPLANPAQAKAAARVLEAEMKDRFYVVRTEKGLAAMSAEDPTLPATDPESKTTVNLSNFAKSVLSDNGFLTRNKGAGDESTPPPADPSDDKQNPGSNGTPQTIAAGSHQDAMLKIYERFRPPQQ